MFGTVGENKCTADMLIMWILQLCPQAGSPVVCIAEEHAFKGQRNENDGVWDSVD